MKLASSIAVAAYAEEQLQLLILQPLHQQQQYDRSKGGAVNELATLSHSALCVDISS
jgi:hypothetical protein